MKKNNNKEDRSFQKFMAVCYILGFISLLSAGYVWAFGIPNFSNLDEQRSFCFNEGGMPIEPSRQNYNTMICMFDFNNTWGDYAMLKVVNEFEGSEKKKGDLCFICWDRGSCGRDVLTKLDGGVRRKTRC